MLETLLMLVKCFSHQPVALYRFIVRTTISIIKQVISGLMANARILPF